MKGNLCSRSLGARRLEKGKGPIGTEHDETLPNITWFHVHTAVGDINISRSSHLIGISSFGVMFSPQFLQIDHNPRHSTGRCCIASDFHPSYHPIGKGLTSIQRQ